MLPIVCWAGLSLSDFFRPRLLVQESPQLKKGKIFLIRKKNERVDHRESLSSVLGKLFELRVSMRLIKKKNLP